MQILKRTFSLQAEAKLFKETIDSMSKLKKIEGRTN